MGAYTTQLQSYRVGAGAAFQTADTPPVPPGYRWILRDVSMFLSVPQVGTDQIRISLIKPGAISFLVVLFAPATAVDGVRHWEGRLAVEAGDILRISVLATTAAGGVVSTGYTFAI